MTRHWVAAIIVTWAMSSVGARAQQPADAPHEHGPVACEDPVPGTPRPAYGCFNVGTVNGLRFADSVTYWHLSSFPTREAAEAARSPNGLVVVEHETVWLNELGPRDAPSRGGTKVATVGPLILPKAATYTAVFSYAVMIPGQRSRVHTHPGPEGWYVLDGEQCLDTSVGVFHGRAGGTVVAPGNVPMELLVTGNTVRRALVVVVHDATKPRGTTSQWVPPGRCRT